MIRHLKIHACRESMPQKREIEKWQTWQSAWPSGHKLQPSLPKKVQLKWRGVKKKARVKEDSEHMLLSSFILPLTIWVVKTWGIQIDQSTFHPHSTAEVVLVGQTPNLQTSHPPWADFYLKLWNEWYAKLLLIGRQRLWRRSN